MHGDGHGHVGVRVQARVVGGQGELHVGGVRHRRREGDDRRDEQHHEQDAAHAKVLREFGSPNGGGAEWLHPRPTDDQALAAVKVTGIVKVAPWQPVSEAFVIATLGTVKDSAAVGRDRLRHGGGRVASRPS